MKKRIPAVFPAFFVLLWISPFGRGQISGSPHDFSGSSWNGSGEICVVCHTPHNSDTAAAGAPLWNHRVTTATFTLYSSRTLVVQPEQPRGVTRLCLSCHDGTVALDSFGGMTGNTFISGDANLGTNLSDDHPVSIKWKHQNRNPARQLPNCFNCHKRGGWRPITSELPFFDGYVECATCHDPHNGTSGYGHLLRKTLAGSRLCLHCHRK